MNNGIIIEALEKEKRDLIVRLDAINAHIELLKGTQALSVNHKLESIQNSSIDKDKVKKYAGYKKEMPFKHKMLYVIKEENRFLHVRELEGILREIDDTVTDNNIDHLSQTLSNAKKMDDSNLVTFKANSSNMSNFWGSKKWLDENGNIKPEHMYNAEILNESNKEEYFL